MPATAARQTVPDARLAVPSSVSDLTADRVFSALEPLHGLPHDQVELLNRAAAGLRFIRSTDSYTHVEHELFRIALAELDPADAFVVEAAACCAADLVPFGDRGNQRSARRADRLRALWFAAILRVADALRAHGGVPPTNVFATWTPDVLYLEFDGSGVSQQQLETARTRVAALEALTGRTVTVASSAIRRGAA